MQVDVTKKFNNGNVEATFHIDEKDDKSALVMLTFLTKPDFCHLDGFKEAPVKWESRRSKGKEGTPNAGKTFTYIERKAYATDGRVATSVMGEYQEGGYYWKQWEVYDPKAEKNDDF
jgi:hypothetical protein